LFRLELQKKTALITGAAQGIGQAIAAELARAGADIIGADLQVGDLQETGDFVRACGRRFVGFGCDVTNKAAVENLIAAAQSGTGFDILINNAGILPSGPFLERDFEVWQKTLDVNLRALMHVTYSALPHLLEKKGGHIVNMASIAGKLGTEGVAAYAASKHGVVGFSSALRSELSGTGVGVSWVCPSLVKTRMSEGVTHTFLTPMVTPDEVARAVRRTIERDRIEVFVPRRSRLFTSLIPSLTPKLARWILKTSGASKGWVEARKELPGEHAVSKSKVNR